MSSETLQSLESLPPVFTDKLKRLRRRVVLWFTVASLIRVLATGFVLVAFDLAIDWYFRMDLAQRGIMLVLMAATLLWAIWRHLIVPLRSRPSDEALCLEMEKHGDRSEALISALEFSRTDWSRHPNVAPGLVRKTIAQGTAAGEALPLTNVLRQSRFRINSLILLALLAAAVGFTAACVHTATFRTWANRNLFLGNAAWPQDFYLHAASAEGTTLRVPRGDDYLLTALVQPGYRFLPEEVNVEFRSGAGRRSETMVKAEDGTAFNHQMISVTERLTFRFTSKKIRSEWYQIELLRRPEITDIELLTRPPDYTGAEVSALPAGQGPYYVLKGSSLGIRGSADKRLTHAYIESGETQWPLQIRDQSFGGAVPAGALISGTYTLHIEDSEAILQPGTATPQGLGTREPLRFKIRLKDDQSPKIKARLEGVSGMVVPRARLPYEATLSDDFSITQVNLVWEWRADNSEAEETTGSHTPAGFTDRKGEPDLELAEAFDIEALEIPAGSRLSLHLEATDNDIVSGPKTGLSTKMIVRVVSEAELRDDLLRREKDQRQIVTDLVDRQDILLTECQALLAETRNADELDSEQHAQLVKFTKRQTQMSQGILPVARRLRGMMDEILNNKLEEANGILQERLLDRVIEPLEAVANTELSLATEYLGRVRRASDPPERQVVFQAAVSNQLAGLRRLREILVHMVKNESYQQAVNLLYEIQKSQEDLRKRTEKKKTDLLDDVLQDGAPEEVEEATGDRPATIPQP